MWQFKTKKMKRLIPSVEVYHRIIRSLKKTTLVLFPVSALAFGGCTTKFGYQTNQSRFVYPNSNVVKLGPTSASIKKVGFLFPPTIKIQDVKKVNEQALAKVPTANVLLDYAADSTFTAYPVIPIYVVTYSEEGTAARQTIGMQKLR